MGRRPKNIEPKRKVRRKKLKKIILAPKGMPDILPADASYWKKVIKAAEKTAEFYGFKKIDLPLVEQAELYLHGTGNTTEIVQRQMYNFKTPGGDSLALRPEFTPGIVRAYLQHGMASLPKPLKFFTYGPLFRYEQPQRGRFRQFWQYDFEILGEKDPIYDALTIQAALDSFKELKIKNLIVEINSIGCDNCRFDWRKKLKTYFSSRKKNICSDCKRRYRDNVLRILDCKKEECRELSSKAPKMMDNLCLSCRKHFMMVLEYLEEMKIDFVINHCLVRGLDYYTRTVFEIKEGGDNLALAGGGRYDYLAEVLGGQSTAGVGVAAGVERLVNFLKEKGDKAEKANNRVFVVFLGDLAKKKGWGLIDSLREGGINFAEAFGKDSLKAQLKQADKMGISLVVILGQKEANEGTAIIRDMKSGAQEVVALNRLAEQLKKKMRNIK